MAQEEVEKLKKKMYDFFKNYKCNYNHSCDECQELSCIPSVKQLEEMK